MPFPMGKGHLLPWGIRGHPLTRSWHFVYTKCVSCKSLAAFFVPEIEQRSGNGTWRCPKNGTMFGKWNVEMSQKWNNVRERNRELSRK